MDSICFILGAGASVDSGLFTYRGSQGIYKGNDESPEKILTMKSFCEDPMKVWNILNPQFEKMKQAQLGPTYQEIQKLCQKFPNSFVLTQNVDRLATQLPVDVIELHGRYDEMICSSCGEILSSLNSNRLCETCNVICRPNILFFDEKLSENTFNEVYKLLDRNPKTVVIIGTTLQFLYLKAFIIEMKAAGAKIIHINPDLDYWQRISAGEIHIAKDAVQGLREIFESY